MRGDKIMKVNITRNRVILSRTTGGVTATFHLDWVDRAIFSRFLRESRLSYRLKRWFLSLRVVNNWRWRRGCEVPKKSGYEANCKVWCWAVEMTAKIHLGSAATFELPDYPSIKALEQREVKA